MSPAPASIHEILALIRWWKDEPFFIQLAHYAGHTPIQAFEEVAAKCRREGRSEANAKYAAMVESVDDSTGQILATLEELDLDEKTLVIFTSDNGGLDRNGAPAKIAPLPSGKGYAYEDGIRVPLLVRWPGTVPGGVVSRTPACSVDLFPTILEAAGVPLPEARAIDGLSLLQHLKSGAVDPLARDGLIWHYPHYRHPPGPYSIIRKGDYKLIKFWEGVLELYDLEHDLSEAQNLAESMPEKVEELEKALNDELKGMGAKLPRPNPDYRE